MNVHCSFCNFITGESCVRSPYAFPRMRERSIRPKYHNTTRPLDATTSYLLDCAIILRRHHPDCRAHCYKYRFYCVITWWLPSASPTIICRRLKEHTKSTHSTHSTMLQTIVKTNSELHASERARIRPNHSQIVTSCGVCAYVYRCRLPNIFTLELHEHGRKTNQDSGEQTKQPCGYRQVTSKRTHNRSRSLINVQ